MAWIAFGEYTDGRPYRTLDERVMRGSAGIMLALALVAAVNGFVLRNYIVVPYVSGFLVINFLVGLLVNPNFSPTVLVAKVLVRKQTPLPFGAIQKKFAWGLGLALALLIFSFSMLLQQDESWFEPVCFLCVMCIALLYLETAFGICLGCKLYQASVWLKLLKKPEVQPNCMGDACKVEAK